MEDLSVFKAFVQILKAIKFASPVSVEQLYSLEIKSVRPFENSGVDDNLLFHFKLSSSCDILSKDILESDEMDALIKIVHKMQSVEEESHLCIQEIHPESPQKILQKGYTVEIKENNSLKLTESWVKEKKSKNNQGVKIHLRIYKLKHSMMTEYSKICQYIKLMKLINPNMVFSSSMVVEDNVCINDYSCSYTPVIGSEIHVCNNTDYYMNSRIKPIYPRIFPFCGDNVILPNSDLGCGLNAVFRIQVVSFQAAYRSTELNPHSHAFMILFGPSGVPIYPSSSACDPYNILAELPWNHYQFKSCSQKSSEECCLFETLHKGTLNPHFNVSLVPVSRQNIQQIVYMITIVDLVDECKSTTMKKRALEWLSCNWCLFIQNNKEQFKKATISSLDKTMCIKSKYSNENLYNKAINDITTSVSSIIMRSTNENFRGKCFKLLQVNSARSAEQILKHKLQVIARSRGVGYYDNEQYKEPAEEKEQTQETSDNMYYSHTADQSNTQNEQRTFKEMITNNAHAVETDLSESEINESFEINEEYMWHVDGCHDANIGDHENDPLLNFDPYVETEIFNYHHSNNLLDIEDETMMSLTIPFVEDEKKVTENSSILERDSEEELNYHINSTVTSKLNDDIQYTRNKNSLENIALDQHGNKNTDQYVTGNAKTVVSDDSEEWFNDVLNDVDDWLHTL